MIAPTYTLTVEPAVDLLPPGVTARTLTVNTTDAALAATAAAPSAIVEADIAWGRPSALSHAEQATSRLTIRATDADAALLTFDALVTLVADHHNGRTPSTILRGWVQSITKRRDRRRPGVADYTLTLTNVLGRLAGIKLAASPWPVESQSARLDHIAAALPMSGLLDTGSAGSDNPITVVARDVDNIDALEVIARTVAAGATWLDEGERGAYYRPTPHPTGGIVVTVPARYVIDADRVLDRTGVLTQATIEAGHDGSVVYRRTPRPRTMSADWRVATDLDVADIPATFDTLVADVLATTAAPVYLLDDTEVLLDELPTTTVSYLTSIASRGTVIVELDGAPSDVERLQHLTAGRLLIRDGRWRLTVTLRPITLAGNRPATFSDSPWDSTTVIDALDSTIDNAYI